MGEPAKPVAVWKRVIAAILDLFTAFYVLGWLLAGLTGSTMRGGFSLNGGPAVALTDLIIAPFFIERRNAGSTQWDRIFGIGRLQPN